MTQPKPPNNKKLVLTQKQKQSSPYQVDARTIEQWAQNVGFIQEIATNTPSDISIINPEGPDTYIDFTGSSGSSSTDTGFAMLVVGMDANDWDSSGIYLGPAETQTNGVSYWPILDNTSASGFRHYDLSMQWMMEGNPGDSVCFLPAITTPNFSGPPTMAINVQIQAMDGALNNLAIYNATEMLGPSSGGQLTAADFSGFVLAGTDLVLTAGTGDSGNGLVTSGGGIVYWASCQVEIIVGPSTTVIPTP